MIAFQINKITNLPRTPYCPPNCLCSSALTAPTFATPFNAVASFVYSGTS